MNPAQYEYHNNMNMIVVLPELGQLAVELDAALENQLKIYIDNDHFQLQKYTFIIIIIHNKHIQLHACGCI